MSAGARPPSPVDRRRFLIGAGLLGAASVAGAAEAIVAPDLPTAVPAGDRTDQGRRPNILLITADDMDGHTPAAFADRRSAHGVTPHIDALARQGMTFHRAHVIVAVCQPSRSALMTGLLPHHNGAVGFEPIHPGVELLTDILRRHGYLNAILGKVAHLEPISRFRWDLVREGPQLGQGRDPELYRAAAAALFDRAAAEDRPWFLMANSHDPHRPFHGSAQEITTWNPLVRAGIPAPSRVFDPDHLEPPGFLPDLAPVRQEYAEYLSSARRCDDTVGALLAQLQVSGQADNTMIIFLSDNGMSFPFAKSNCYLRSTLTPMIISWPGRVRAGVAQRRDFVSSLDLFPTICEAIGADVPEGLDGRSLTSLLLGADPPVRDHIFTVYDEITPTRRYEMRCVQDAHYGYIWNAWSDGTTKYRAENQQGLTWKAMVQAARHDQSLAQRVRFYRYRAPEELYNLAVDPNCRNNIAHRPEHQATLQRYRNTLDAWMRRNADPLEARFARLLT